MTDKSKEQTVIDAHMSHLNNRLDRFDDLLDKLFDRQEEMAKILERNTVTVEEHHKRSTNLEILVNSLKSALDALASKFTLLEDEVEEIKDDVTPIKNHVSEVSSVMHFLAWTPKFIKAIILIITLVTTVYGLKSLFDDFNKTKETIELKK